jgi:Secretion system C-terminal sorting domain
MKKITFLAAMLMGVATFAQTTLSHSEDNTVVASGSVACVSNPDQIPANGDEFTTDNQFWRSYTPAAFGETGNLEVSAAEFFITFTDIGGTNPTISAIVTIWSTDAAFPSGTLTEIATQNVDITPADDGEKITATFDTPAIVSADDEVVVSVAFLEAPEAPMNYDVRIGINDLGQDAPSYLSSTACGITNPTDTAAIGGGFPDNHLILDLIVDEVVLGINDNLADAVSIFPNPTTDVLNVSIPSNVEVKSVALFDVLGKDTGVRLSNGTINTSNLARGVYILNINTDRGSLTEKIVKQ